MTQGAGREPVIRTETLRDFRMPAAPGEEGVPVELASPQAAAGNPVPPAPAPLDRPLVPGSPEAAGLRRLPPLDAPPPGPEEETARLEPVAQPAESAPQGYTAFPEEIPLVEAAAQTPVLRDPDGAHAEPAGVPLPQMPPEPPAAPRQPPHPPEFKFL